MKTRSGFVSNSSSSSFIILTNQEIEDIKKHIEGIIDNINIDSSFNRENVITVTPNGIRKRIKGDVFCKPFELFKKTNKSEIKEIIEGLIYKQKHIYEDQLDSSLINVSIDIDTMFINEDIKKLSREIISSKRSIYETSIDEYKTFDRIIRNLTNKIYRTHFSRFKYIQIQEYSDNGSWWYSTMEHEYMPRVMNEISCLNNTICYIKSNH